MNLDAKNLQQYVGKYVLLHMKIQKEQERKKQAIVYKKRIDNLKKRIIDFLKYTLFWVILLFACIGFAAFINWCITPSIEIKRDFIPGERGPQGPPDICVNDHWDGPRGPHGLPGYDMKKLEEASEMFIKK